MFEKKDRAFFDSIFSKIASKGENGGVFVNKIVAKIIKGIIMGLSLLFIGGIIFFVTFLKSAVTKKSK